MDARITKQRLANMLSYDWLKIVGAIALAAVAFCVFFLMIATTPTAGQTFYVYAYDGLTGGMDFSRLNNEFENKNIFSLVVLPILLPVTAVYLFTCLITVRKSLGIDCKIAGSCTVRILVCSQVLAK